MPAKDIRTRAGLKNAKNSTSGNMVVTYRDAQGKQMDAIVVGQGTSSGLKLRVRNRLGPVVIDNVPKATTVKSNGSYISRSFG